MSTNHVYVLHAEVEGGELRHAVHLCGDSDSIIESISTFLGAIERPLLSTSHVLALAAGPNHPAFRVALTDLQLTSSHGCPTPVVKRAVEMLIACAMLPPNSEYDESLLQALYASFSTENDWKHFTYACQIAALTFLTHHEAVSDDFSNHTLAEREIVTQLSSALCVAMIQARAELQRELTAQSADSDG